jgi:hypothetical protein
VNVKEVLGYFLRNPQAADTLEGVARWRLMDERIHGSVQETAEVLAWLVTEGFLLKASAEGSGPIFSLNTRKRAQAQRLLAKVRNS